jgi:hypothetical protein
VDLSTECIQYRVRQAVLPDSWYGPLQHVQPAGGGQIGGFLKQPCLADAWFAGEDKQGRTLAVKMLLQEGLLTSAAYDQGYGRESGHNGPVVAECRGVAGRHGGIRDAFRRACAVGIGGYLEQLALLGRQWQGRDEKLHGSGARRMVHVAFQVADRSRAQARPRGERLLCQA